MRAFIFYVMSHTQWGTEMKRRFCFVFKSWANFLLVDSWNVFSKQAHKFTEKKISPDPVCFSATTCWRHYIHIRQVFEKTTDISEVSIHASESCESVVLLSFSHIFWLVKYMFLLVWCFSVWLKQLPGETIKQPSSSSSSTTRSFTAPSRGAMRWTEPETTWWVTRMHSVMNGVIKKKTSLLSPLHNQKELKQHMQHTVQYCPSGCTKLQMNSWCRRKC